MPPAPTQPPKRRRPSSPGPTPTPAPARAPKRPNTSLTKPFKSPLKQPEPSADKSTSASTSTSAKSTPRRQPQDLATARALQADIAALEQALHLLRIPLPSEAGKQTSADASAEEIYARTDADGTPIPHADARLEARTAAWRSAAREAAEIVRADMAGRVRDAGGVRAWRARECDGVRDDEAVFEGLSALERREVRRLKEEADEENWDGPAGGTGHDGDDDEGGGGELTMGVMLGMLHVEPSLLGWLEEEQRWRDE